MRTLIKTALALLILLTILTGVIYPLAITGIAQLIYPVKANGSMIFIERKHAGSDLIGQPFSSPGYFFGRPSATTPNPYNGASSLGSNYGPLNPQYLDSVREQVRLLAAEDTGGDRPVPVDLVTASASGLDPHISIAAAEYQVGRIARIRHLPVDVVHRLVEVYTEGRQFGFLGEPRVNVLRLNLALDGMAPLFPEKVP